MELDGVQIGAERPETAVEEYRRLLEVEPLALPGGAHRFQLARGAVEIVPGAPGVRALRFVGAPPAGWPDEAHGVRLLVGPGPRPLADGTTTAAIDHVVVRTADPERAIALWRDRLGLGLALDRVFPDRGLRLVFFRSGGITLEYAAPHPAAPADGPDRLWGVSYRVSDLEARRARLEAAGVNVSPARAGLRPGTSVVSVRSGTAGVPTLLLRVDVT